MNLPQKRPLLRVDMADSMVLTAIFLAAAYWGLEALINLFSPAEISFYREVFGTNVGDMSMRVIVLCLFLIFGSHVRHTINQRKRADQALLESYRKLQYARAATILGLAKLAEYRDEGTGTHLERIREYARLLAEEMAKVPRYREYIDQRYVDDLYQSAILHDIGKVGIPDAVLLKPGELTDEEFELIKRHTLFGGDAISAIQAQIEGRSFLNLGKEIAYCHHEKWDGSGYPHGLSGREIPLAARIVAVADVYDALTTKRFYKEAFSHDKARQIIVNLRGQQFDPEVVDAFLALEGQFDRIREEKLRQEKTAVSAAGESRPAVPPTEGADRRAAAR
jgi:response regulator RpfG family c-di-GMP phosphodiesterase